MNVKKRFGKYLLYPASFKIIARLLGGPEIRTPKEIIEYSFEILASHFMKTNEYFFLSTDTIGWLAAAAILVVRKADAGRPLPDVLSLSSRQSASYS